MGILRKIADRFDPPANQNLETRAALDPSWAALAGGGAFWPAGRVAGSMVTPKQAETLAMVLACVNVVSASIASLPAFVYKWAGGKRELDESHPVARLIRAGANDWQTWPEFLEWLAAQALLHGNGLAEIVAGRNGDILALKPHPWPNVTVRQLANGRLVYDVADFTPLGGTGRVRRLLADEVIHLKDRSDDGLIGVSRLRRSPAILRLGLSAVSLDEFLYDNAGRIGGVLQLAQGMKIGDEAAKNLRNDWERLYAGLTNAGRAAVLPGGVEFKPISHSPEAMEATAAKKLIREELATLFGVPLPIVNVWDHSSFTNSVEANKWYANYTLAPWTVKIQEAFRRSVFTASSRETHELTLDLSAFLRGDAEARWKSYEIAVKNNILTANEVRAQEGYDPRPELDDEPPSLGGE